MRILYSHRTQGEEPESIHIRALVRAFERAGHPTTVVGPVPIAGPHAPQPSSATVRAKRRLPRLLLEPAQLAYNAVSATRVWRAIRRVRPDLVYERYALFNFGGVLAARAAGLPVVLEVNTLYASAWRRYYGLALWRLAERIENWLLRRADLVVVVSEVLRGELLARRVPEGRMVVSPNGVDEAFWRAGTDGAEERRRLGLSGRTVVGFVGTLNRWQGIDVLAAAAEALLPRHPELAFLIVGQGEGMATLRRRLGTAVLAGRVVLVGRAPHAEVPKLIAAMDIGVLPDSNDYGSPMKLFEYAALGKAIVAPRVGPVLEVFEDAVHALLVPRGQVGPFVDAIDRLLADPALREALGCQAASLVRARFTWDANARTILERLGARLSARDAGAPAREERAA